MKLKSFWLALLMASVSLNGVTFEAEAESIFDGTELIEIEQLLNIEDDPAIKGEAIDTDDNLADPENITSVLDTWDKMSSVFDVKGSFVGGSSQEFLMTLTNATTDSGGYMRVSGLFRAPPNSIMSGASEGWMRLPVAVSPYNNVTLKVYHIDNPNEYKVEGANLNAFSIAPLAHPTLVWKHDYGWSNDFYNGAFSGSDVHHIVYTGSHGLYGLPNDSIVHPYCGTWTPFPVDGCDNPLFNDQTATWSTNKASQMREAVRITANDGKSNSDYLRTYLWWSFPWHPDEHYAYVISYEDKTYSPHDNAIPGVAKGLLNETSLFGSIADIGYDDIYQSFAWFADDPSSATIKKWDLPIDLGVSNMYVEGMGYGVRGENLSRVGNSDTDIEFYRTPGCPGGYDGVTNSPFAGEGGNEPSFVDSMIGCYRHEAADQYLHPCEYVDPKYGTTDDCFASDNPAMMSGMPSDLRLLGTYDFAGAGTTHYNGLPNDDVSPTGNDFSGEPGTLDLMVSNNGCIPGTGVICTINPAYASLLGINYAGSSPVNMERSASINNLGDNNQEAGFTLTNGYSPQDPGTIGVPHGGTAIEETPVPSEATWEFDPNIMCSDMTVYPAANEKCVNAPSLTLGPEKSQDMFNGAEEITFAGVFQVNAYDRKQFCADDMYGYTPPGTNIFDGTNCPNIDADVNANALGYKHCFYYGATLGEVQGAIPGGSHGETCSTILSYTEVDDALPCGAGIDCTTHKPVGFRLYVYEDGYSVFGPPADDKEPHPIHGCRRCLVAEFSDGNGNYVSASVGDIHTVAGTKENRIDAGEWYFYTATFKAYGDSYPPRPAEAHVCMAWTGDLGDDYDEIGPLICSHEEGAPGTDPCDFSATMCSTETNSAISKLGTASGNEMAYWYGNGHASPTPFMALYGGHCYCSSAIDMVFDKAFTQEDAKVLYYGMYEEATKASTYESAKALRDIPMFIDSGMIFWDKFESPFDSTKDRLTFTMPFARKGEPTVVGTAPNEVISEDTLMMVIAIAYDENLDIMPGKWTACSQLVTDHIICSGRDTDIDHSTHGKDSARHAWGMAYMGDNTYDDFYDFRPDGSGGTTFMCDGDTCLHGATYIKFIVGWTQVLPGTENCATQCTSVTRDHSNTLGGYDTIVSYEDGQMQSFYAEDGYDLEIDNMGFWLHDKYGNKVDEAGDDYSLLNAVWYFEDYIESYDGANNYVPCYYDRNTWDVTHEGTYCERYNTGSVNNYEIFNTHQGMYNHNTLPLVITYSYNTLYYLTNPDSDDKVIKERHRNFRPFHTFETSSGSWANLNPVEHVNNFRFDLTIVLDGVVFENEEAWEIMPNFIQRVNNNEVWVTSSVYKGTGFPLGWTTANGITGASEFADLYTWAEEQERQYKAKTGFEETENNVVSHATVHWATRNLAEIAEITEWYGAMINTFVSFIVSRLTYTLSTLIDVGLFIIPISIFAVGIAICFAWLKITVAAIRGEWEIVEQLIDGGGFLGIRAAFINVKELREYE